jgi:hypothetical protein
MAIDDLVQHTEGLSRRQFLKGGLAALATSAGVFYMSSIARAEQPYFSKIPVLDVNERNYKDWIQKNIVETKKDGIIVYYHLGLIPKLVKEQGEVALKDIENWETYLQNEMSPRVPVYRIEMKDWSRGAIIDWADNINKKRIIPSSHLYLSGDLKLRMRGVASLEEKSNTKEELDNYLTSYGRLRK